jgi:diguanylate cyclase
MHPLEHVLSDDAAPDFALRVQADQLRLLFRQSFPAVYISVVVALVVCQTLWTEVRHELLLGWLFLLCLCSLVRYSLFRLYWQRKPQGMQILAWEKPYALTLFATSLIWGLGILWFVSESAPLYRLVEFLFLLGMSAGAFSHYSARRYMVMGAMTSVLLPTTIWFFFCGQSMEVSLGIAALLFVCVLIQAGNAMSAAQAENLRLTYSLEAARYKAEQMAHTDELTGLENRRAFFEQAQALANYCERNRRPLSVVMIDADHFKQINDRFGHAVGDAVLCHLAGHLKARRRKSDVCGRLGGEEFAMLLPDTSLGEAMLLAERLCQACAAQPMHAGEEAVVCTVSIGVASEGYSIEYLLSCADEALYQAKAAGRNRAMAWSNRDIIAS